MWIDTNSYKHYDSLIALGRIIQSDFEKWKLKYGTNEAYAKRIQVQKFEHHDVYPDYAHVKGGDDLYHRPEAIEDRPNPNEYWFCDAVFTDCGNKLMKNYEDWKESAELALKLPGIVQYIVNFVKPQSELPSHDDTGGWKRIEKDIGRKLNGFSNVLGLATNSSNMGFVFKNRYTGVPEKKGWNTGEWVTFEGKTHYHDVYNHSNDWRVTAVIDLEYTQYNLKNPDLYYLQSRWETYTGE